jgi:hypothetical protein
MGHGHMYPLRSNHDAPSLSEAQFSSHPSFNDSGPTNTIRAISCPLRMSTSACGRIAMLKPVACIRAIEARQYQARICHYQRHGYTIT